MLIFDYDVNCIVVSLWCKLDLVYGKVNYHNFFFVVRTRHSSYLSGTGPAKGASFVAEVGRFATCPKGVGCAIDVQCDQWSMYKPNTPV